LIQINLFSTATPDGAARRLEQLFDRVVPVLGLLEHALAKSGSKKSARPVGP
jgi:hypothetical protein